MIYGTFQVLKLCNLMDFIRQGSKVEATLLNFVSPKMYSCSTYMFSRKNNYNLNYTLL